jgi:hypothetical protein
MSMRTMRLEKEYEKTLSDSARLLDGERDRVRRMELLLSKIENEALRSQLEEANRHLLGFTGADSEACAQLQEACQEIDHLELQAQASASEIDRLKVSFNSVEAECMIGYVNSNRKSSQSRKIVRSVTVLSLQRNSISLKNSQHYTQSLSDLERKTHYIKPSFPRNMRWNGK